jgi:hypothetical protein
MDNIYQDFSDYLEKSSNKQLKKDYGEIIKSNMYGSQHIGKLLCETIRSKKSPIFNVGDMVRIVPFNSYEQYRFKNSIETLKKYAGQTYSILKAKVPDVKFEMCYNDDGFIYQLDGIESIVFTSNMLEHVEEKEDTTYQRISEFYDGFARVNLKDKYNFIDENYKLLSPNQWFDFCLGFNEGFGEVNLNGKWNFIDKNGKLLSPNQWFDMCLYFHGGFANVKLNGKGNYIDHNGNLYDTNFQPIHMNKIGLD